MSIFARQSRNPQHLIVFIMAFAVLGAAVVFNSFAATTSSISGTMWQDTNRNGILDPGEVPFSGKEIHLYDSTGQNTALTTTDANGHYQFDSLADGQYRVAVGTPVWWELRHDWTPTTGNELRNNYSKDVALTSTATANIGLRQIVRSADRNAPLTTYTAASGLKINSYVDVVSAQEVYEALAKSALVGGPESPLTTINFGFSENSVTSAVAQQSNGGLYTGYNASSYVSYLSWLDGYDRTLMHEYGHAWSLYYGYIVQQDPTMVEYQKVRGIYGDSRVNSNYEWQVNEIIAEDYRQLFGTANAAGGYQTNSSIPLAKDVPGLKEYLTGRFMNEDRSVPTTPRDLTGIGISPSQIKLSWTASTDNLGVTGYDIYRDGQKITSVGGSTTTYTDSGLSSLVTYNYYVTARDASGNTSLASTAININTLAPPPSAPTGLQATGVTDTTASIKWTASLDNTAAATYEVYRNGQKVGIVNTPSTSYFDSNLLPNTIYSYTVRARDAAGVSSGDSAALSVKTLPPDTQAPSKPSNLKLTSISSTTASLSWTGSNDNVGVVSYHIYKSGSNTVLKTTSVANGTVSGLAPNTQYSLYVTAVDQAGNESLPSNLVKVRTARK